MRLWKPQKPSKLKKKNQLKRRRKEKGPFKTDTRKNIPRIHSPIQNSNFSTK